MNRNTVLGITSSVFAIAIFITFIQADLFFWQNNSTSESIIKATELNISKLANANNSFGFDLFFQLDTEQNIVISPSSIALA